MFVNISTLTKLIKIIDLFIKNKFYSINDLKSKFYYSILVEYWQRLFQLELLHKDWNDIYI